VQYLQSSVLPSPSILEDNAYASLTNILFFNKVEIVSMIQEDGEFLQDLFNQIISKDTGTERKRELVLFLREYCIFSQTIQPKQRDSFFKTLASLKILSAVEVALSSNDQVTKSAAIDIFTYIVEYNPNMTREHAVQQSEGLIDSSNNGAHILKLVIQHITTDQDPELGTATQLSCIIKLLLDPENMPGDSVGKHSFLEFFYFTCMQSVMEPIKNATTPDVKVLKASANDRRTAQLLSIMLELLTFFMEHHYSQLRSYIISTDLLSRIITLMKSRHKFLVLSKYDADHN
jgi:protein phosphatase-4 regulatory subunit 3